MQPFVEMENFHENVQIKITYDAIQHGLSVGWDLLERVLVFIFFFILNRTPIPMFLFLFNPKWWEVYSDNSSSSEIYARLLISFKKH